MYEKVNNSIKKDFGRVAVLFGGMSAERDISLKSGTAVLAALLENEIDAVGIDVDSNIVNTLLDLKPEIAFLALHGIGGEDGKIQGLLDWMEIPYTGSNHAASALAMNKLTTKQVWTGMGLPTPKYVVLKDDDDWMSVMQRLNLQVFVKPANEGSSLGMSYVETNIELQLAYSKAREHDCTVIAEQRVVGAEYTVAILNGQPLPPIQLKTKNDYYDYDAKYISDDTEYLCPCDLSEEKIKEIQSIAINAFDALGCRGWGRIDFMQDEQQNFYLLEANTIPGMTGHSLVPMAAKAAGLDFSQLVMEILYGVKEG